MLQPTGMREFLDGKMYIVISLWGFSQREIPMRHSFVAILLHYVYSLRKTNGHIASLGSKTKKQCKTEMSCKKWQGKTLI